MKTLLLVFMTMVMATMGIHAQKGTTQIDPSNYRQLAEMQVTILTKKLSLTAIQKDSVLQIFESYFQKISGIRSQQLGNEEIGDRLRIFQSEWTSRLQRVLSVGQYRQFLEDKEQAMKRTDSLRAHFKHEGQ